MFLKRIEKIRRYVCSAATLTSLPVHPHAKKLAGYIRPTLRPLTDQRALNRCQHFILHTGQGKKIYKKWEVERKMQACSGFFYQLVSKCLLTL